MAFFPTPTPAKRRVEPRKIIAVTVVAVVVAALATVDGLVAAVFGVSIAAIYAAVHWRGPRRLRRTAIATTTVLLICGVVAALALPVYSQRPSPLVINLSAESAATRTSSPLTDARPSFDVLGYVASDYEDTSAGVDADVTSVTSLAATGITLGKQSGTLEVADAGDTLVRAHAQLTRALAVVSNFDGSNFNGDRVERLLDDPHSRRKVISALTKLVSQKGWDGVVIDFENLTPGVRRSFPSFLRDLHEALGSRTMDVAVPAFTDPKDPDLFAYDMKAIASAADRVTWMAYDQHELTTAAGPIASLDWTRASLDLALRTIPSSKLLLGIASYGYAWSSPGHAVEYSARQAAALAAAPGARVSFDAVAGEETGTLADHRTIWYPDRRSMALRSQLALDRHLGGVALWRVGAEEPGALDALPAAAKRQRPLASSSDTRARGARAVEDVHVNGVVALTFDDGPDPRWTPKLLGVLRREHVPATFFVIGQQAQQHQGLVREAMRDGNVIGNHTYSHKNLATISTLRAKVEILGGAAVIEGITGHKAVLFRSPYGAGDMSGKKVGGDQLANDLGEHAVAWNVDPQDWAQPGAARIATRVASQMQERSVVLLHDGGGDRSQTLAALPQIIENLKRRGYLFTTVDGLDGSIGSPYAPRHGLFARLRGLAIVAGFRMWVAGRETSLLLLAVVAMLSIARLVWSVPLALLQAVRHRRWRRRTPPATAPRTGAPWPTVTIAVPAHNEAVVIAKTVTSLQALRHPEGRGSIEILVIDDGSTDDTATLAKQAAAGDPAVRVISQTASKKAGALNSAFSEAGGEIVVVIDADTVVDAGLVEAMLPHFDNPRVGAVAGNVKVGNQKTLFGKLQALEYVVSLNLDRRAQAAADVMAVVPGAAGAFRRSAVLSAGGYSTDTLVEDADLTVTLLSAGWSIRYEPRAIAHTEAPETMRDVIRQRRRWSFGTIELLGKHERRLLARGGGRVGLFGLPWMLLSQVVLPLFGPFTDLFLVYLLLVHNFNEAGGVVALSVAADLAVCAVAVVLNRERWSMLLYVPLLRLVWRPIQLYAIGASMTKWLGGETDFWRTVTRYGTVAGVLPSEKADLQTAA